MKPDRVRTVAPNHVRQSRNSEGLESVDSSVGYPDTQMEGPNALVNLDISARHFMKAMNFDAMADRDVERSELKQNLYHFDCRFCGLWKNTPSSLVANYLKHLDRCKTEFPTLLLGCETDEQVTPPGPLRFNPGNFLFC